MKKVSDFPIANINNYAVNSNSSNSIYISAKILIVDENPLSRMTAVDLLSLDGYEVLEADNIASMQNCINEQKPDLILLDSLMGETDSFSFCRQLKTDYQTASIPIVLTTLNDSRENRIKVMEAGGDDMLVKPLHRIELSTRVKSLINQKRLQEGADQTEQVLFTIAKAVDNRSFSRGGSVRVATLVKSFGEYLSLKAEDIDSLTFAAHLHDLGMIAIPDAVMLKAGELTDEEKELIRQHVLFGEEICQPLRNRSGVLPIIRHHHERWDGTGYPDGLSGSAIPYLAQVFQVIDIYDALTSDRPHKEAYSPRGALNILVDETRKGWRNPQLIDQFTNFIASQPE